MKFIKCSKISKYMHLTYAHQLQEKKEHKMDIKNKKIWSSNTFLPLSAPKPLVLTEAPALALTLTLVSIDCLKASHCFWNELLK